MALPEIYADTSGMYGRSVDQGYIEQGSGSGSLTFGNAPGFFGSETTPFGASGQAQFSFVSTSNVLNHGRVNDNLDSAPANFNSKYNGVRYTLSSAKECDFVAFYCSKTDSNATFYVYTSTSQGTSFSSIANASISAGWNIIPFTATTKQYWVFHIQSSTSSMDLDITEIILGKLFTFNHMWELNGEFKTNVKNKILESYNGEEYSFKLYDGKKEWKVSLPNISLTFKNNLDTLFSDNDFKKKNFMYKDQDAEKYYSRLQSPPKFSQIASNRYKAQLTISE